MGNGEHRQRERLLARGAAAVTDVELLAVYLGTGCSGLPVADLAGRLLNRFGSIWAVLEASPAALLAEPGIGPAKVAVIKAVVGLLERHQVHELTTRPVFNSSEVVRGYLRGKLARARREIFACLFLDSRHRLITYEALFQGTVDRASVYPREVLRRALELNAAAVILAHNHPSGVAEPSPSDIALTDSLRHLLSQIDVRVIDHLVVGRGAEVSFAERGLI
jgi:DNA repair protein RadC